ncbi:MAG: hypothetical protein AB8G96_01295 [Phycisphaerales bacterium]
MSKSDRFPVRGVLVAAMCIATPASLAAAQSVAIEIRPELRSITDMSPDGRWIVGSTASGFPYRLDRTTDELTFMPAGQSAAAVSDDGSVVVGNMIDPDGTGATVAGMWREGEGWMSLGFLPDALQCPSLSNGYEVSADGTVVVGLSWDGCNGVAFWWTEATGMLPLENLANGVNRASVVSADGSVIGGFAQGSFSRTPAKWSSDLSGETLDPTTDGLGEVFGLRDDATVLLGNLDGAAVRWDNGGPPEVIGDGSALIGWMGYPIDIADDETIIGFDQNFTNFRATIQPGGEGPLQLLRTWAMDNGADVPADLDMQLASAISADGSVIVGSDGGFFDGRSWIVTITDPCPGDLDGSGSVGFDDLLTVLSGWGQDAPGGELSDPVDIVDFADLITLLSQWGPCPNTDG